MLITTAPIVIPVNTANLPTESLAAEAVQRPRIPQPPSAAENPATKNSTEFTEQPKAQFENNLQSEQDKNVAEKEQSQQQNSKDENSRDGKNSEQKENSNPKNSSDKQNNDELAAEELQLVQELQKRDREVRAHEQAHAAVGGALAGPAQLSFTTGPDGKRYATSGEVSIDTSKVPNDPAASIRKFEQVQRAALAPASPSSQDVRVASRAAASASQSRAELNVERAQQANASQEQQETDTATKTEESNRSTNTELGQIEVDKPDVLASSSFAEQLVNPVIARRQAAQLNQKIAGSGALDFENQDTRLSLTA